MTRTALKIIFDRDLESCCKEIELFPDDASIWKVVPGIANPAGTLALHIAGNLQHFVGGVLGGTGYVRDRPAEFNRRTGSRADIIEELTRARKAIARTLEELPESALEQRYAELVGGREYVSEDFLIHLATHAAFHLGQLGYLRRMLIADPVSSGAMSNAALGRKPDA